jgi:molecular chaperone DnaK
MIDYSNIPRDSRRVPLETRVQLKFDRFSGFISEYSSNISPGGIFIKTLNPLPAGEVLDFELRLGDGFELIKGNGQVVWTRSEDEGPNRPAGMGLRFMDLSQGSKELIYKIVDTYIQEGGTPFDVSLIPPDPIPTLPKIENLGSAPPFAPPVWPPPGPPDSRYDAQDPALDASSWLPPLDEPPAMPPTPTSSAGEPFSTYLPALQPPPQEQRPASFRLAGSAAAKAPPRRLLPWVMIGALAVLAAAGFLFRETWMGWAGLGEDEPVAQTAPPRALPRPRANPAAALATTDLNTDPGAEPNPADPAGPAAEPETTAPAPPADTAPLPEPVRRKPAIDLAPGGPVTGSTAPARPSTAAAAAGPAVTALEKISWNPLAGGGTEIVLWGNGAMRPEIYSHSRLGGSPPRELFRLQGMARPYPKPRLPVGTGEVQQVRVGYHPGQSNEVHVVLDLASAAVQVTRVVEDGDKLRIELRKR